MLSEIRDQMVLESKRRNDTDKFLQIELDNNAQLRKRIHSGRRELANERQKSIDVDKQLGDLMSEVTSLPLCH